jgi:uncharacterized repeat protein (TIGR02543 family)
VTADATYYARWTVKKYAVTWNANGGKVSGKAKLVKRVKYGSKFGKLSVPTRKGYNFKGWYTKKSSGKKIASTAKMPAKNVTYYARWTKQVKYGAVVDATAVYVRKIPSRHATLIPVIGHLNKNQKFKIRGFVDNPGKSNDWYKLQYKGKTGYIYAKYVKITWK